MIRLRIPQRRLVAAATVMAATMAIVGAAGAMAAAYPTQTSPQKTNGVGAAAPAASEVASRPPILHAGPDDAFTQRPAISSQGWHYVPYERTYRGLPVIGGDFVVVVDPDGRVSSMSVAQESTIKGLEVKPAVTRAAAEEVASGKLESVGKIESSRLVVYALSANARLAWESIVDGVGDNGDSRLVVDVDAVTAAVLDSRESIMHDSGMGGFNGPSPLSIPSSHFAFVDYTQILKTKWILDDPAVSGLNCNASSVFRIDPEGIPVWGNGDPKDVETACVDAMFSAETEVQMLSQWLGRHGMDGDGNGFPMVVGLADTNARYVWGPGKEGVEIGYDLDGKWLSTLDVVGHENGHGVDSHTPGGLSGNGTAEFVADAFGAATEWFANEPAPYDTPDFVIGDRTNLPSAIRKMFAPACYSSSTAGTEVHAAAAPGDHWFYLLAEGTNPTDGQPVSATCNNTTFNGIGIQKTMQILYNAMLMKTSDSSYLKYRTWTLTAARNLFPGDCGVFLGVKAAWDAVSVPAQPGDPDACRLNIGLVPDLSTKLGVPASLQLSATNGTLPYLWSVTGLPTGISSTPAGLISGTPTALGVFSASYTLTDGAGTTATRYFTWTITASETRSFTGTATSSKPTTAESQALTRARSLATGAGFSLSNCEEVSDSVELNEFRTYDASLTLSCFR